MTVQLNDQLEGRMGLPHQLLLKIDKKKEERYPFEANIWFLVGCRELGKGYSSIENVLCCMAVLPLSTSTFTFLNEHLFVAYKLKMYVKLIRCHIKNVCI